jgi:hypothetical protein
MKTLSRTLALSVFTLSLLVGNADAQLLKDLQYYRAPGQAGVNVFEAPKVNAGEFDGLALRVGGDFAIQFQGLDQSNAAGNLVELSPNVTLPSANLNLDVQFAEGVRMHLRSYLSSKHHNEAWVKGGYLQVDNLDFVREGFLSGLMEVTRFRVGMDDISYGDAQFRRSDNASTAYNPFVENYIMDSHTTEPFAEVTVMKSGFLGVAGLTNGRMNQTPTSGDNGVALFGKLGYDSQVNEDLRLRLTGSLYHSTEGGTRDYLYGGDRAGARYHKILEVAGETSPDHMQPRFNPGFAYQTAFQVNPFVKYQGLEIFGVIERSQGGADDAGSFTQLGAELLYRFGSRDQFYVGSRYNTVSGSAVVDGPTQEVNRLDLGGGWFMTPNVLTKVDYVTSSYDGAGFTGKFAGAKYNGLVLEAVINF